MSFFYACHYFNLCFERTISWSFILKGEVGNLLQNLLLETFTKKKMKFRRKIWKMHVILVVNFHIQFITHEKPKIHPNPLALHYII